MKIVKVLILVICIFGYSRAHAQCAAGIGLYGAACTAANAAMGNGVANATAWERFKAGCPTTCALAVMAGIMVVQSLKTAKKAKGIEDDLTCARTNSCFNDSNGNNGNPNGGPNSNLNPRNPADRTLVELERQRPSIERFLNEREREGYSIDRQTGAVKDPNGKPISNMSSAMDSGGMNAEQRAAAERILDEAAKEGDSLAKRLEEYDEEIGGGGGGSGTASGGYNSANPNGSRFGLPNANGITPPSVAGLSVNHGGDQIGVAGDNIFDMIHRRYETTRPEMNPNPNGP
jgi:hypothetical protein